MASSMVSQMGRSSGQLPAASMMARVDRLDLVVGYLEEMRTGGSNRSSSTTTLSSSSPASTPRGSCRPAEELLEEAKAKGSLVERIAYLEDRVLKMEEDRMTSMEIINSKEMMKRNNKKGLKSLVKSCVRGKLNTKD